MKRILGMMTVFLLLLGVFDLHGYFSGLEPNIDMPGWILIYSVGLFIAHFIGQIVASRRKFLQACKGSPDAHTTDSRTRYPYQELDPDPYRERYQPPENRLARRLERARARKRGKIAEWKKQERLKRRERAKSFSEEV